MAFLTDDEIALLNIDKFIFHVVHHDSDEPVLLDRTPIGQFKSFFLDRIKETLSGNRFVFLPDSTTLAGLRAVQENGDQFVPVSKNLARDFHSRRDKRIKPGVFIFMTLAAGPRSFFSLIKYDHEQVVAYEVRQTEAILRSITTTFTQSPNALQKSALVELTADNAEIVVIDKTVRADITDFFRGFLNAKRKFTDSEMTDQVERVLLDTVRELSAELPAEITSHVHDRFVGFVAKRQAFEAPQFVAEYFGPARSEKVERTFMKILDRRGLGGEAFSFDPAAVQPVTTQRYRTIEGVSLQIREQARETVTISPVVEGFSTITIRTRKLIEQ